MGVMVREQHPAPLICSRSGVPSGVSSFDSVNSPSRSKVRPLVLKSIPDESSDESRQGLLFHCEPYSFSSAVANEQLSILPGLWTANLEEYKVSRQPELAYHVDNDIANEICLTGCLTLSVISMPSCMP